MLNSEYPRFSFGNKKKKSNKKSQEQQTESKTNYPSLSFSDVEILKRCKNITFATQLLANRELLLTVKEPIPFFYQLYLKFPQLLSKIVVHKNYVAALGNDSFAHSNLINKMLVSEIPHAGFLVNFLLIAIRQYTEESAVNLLIKISYLINLILKQKEAVRIFSRAITGIVNFPIITLQQKEILLITMLTILEKKSVVKEPDSELVQTCLLITQSILKDLTDVTKRNIQEILKSSLPEEIKQLIYADYKIMTKDAKEADTNFDNTVCRTNYFYLFRSTDTDIKEDKLDYISLFLIRRKIDLYFEKLQEYANAIDLLKGYVEIIQDFIATARFYYEDKKDFMVGLLLARTIAAKYYKSSGEEFYLLTDWDDIAIEILENLKKNKYEEKICAALLVSLEKRFFVKSRAKALQETLNSSRHQEKISFDRVRIGNQIVKIFRKLYMDGDKNAGYTLAMLSVTPLSEIPEPMSYPITLDEGKEIINQLKGQGLHKENCEKSMQQIIKEKNFNGEDTIDETATPLMQSREESENVRYEKKSNCGR